MNMENLDDWTVKDLEDRKAQLIQELAEVSEALETRKSREENTGNGLTLPEILRYSRQLLLPELGVQGQVKMKEAMVLIVGCGGLGCPAAQYLASCGINGLIGLVDHDEVEIGNLHRQVLHSEDTVGVNKAESLKRAILRLNSNANIKIFKTLLNSSNAHEIIKDFDVILDATDNVATRYLLNDACVIHSKPLVSGSALRFEGQLTVYNYQNVGPTYRCLFPEPPPPETVTNCSDGGVLGVVPGVIGTLQALEVIKIVTGMGDVLSGKMLLFDALSGSFRSIRLRPRIDRKIEQLIDYEQFCGASADDKDRSLKVLAKEERISVEELSQKILNKEDVLLVDVREPHELDICKLDATSLINLPLKTLKYRQADGFKMIEDKISETDAKQLLVVCRQGNDSQLAVKKLQDHFSDIPIKDIRGGLNTWALKIDPKFPKY